MNSDSGDIAGTARTTDVVRHLPAESSSWRRFVPKLPVLYVVAGLQFLILLLALLGSAIAPYDPLATDLGASLAAPSADHLVGTDQLGRDIFSRLLAGARTAVLGPLIIAIFVTVVATALALVAGYLGGRIDAMISRVVDVVYSMPPLLVAIIIVGTMGGGYAIAVAVVALFSLPQNVRAVRAAVLEQRNLPYVEAARITGQSRLQIMSRQILPNILPVLVSAGFVRFTFAFVELTTLSFLGLGVDPQTPDWGQMVAESRLVVYENPPAALAPLVFIVVTTVSANLLGEYLFDRFQARGRAR